MSDSLSDAEALRRLRRDPEAVVAIYDRHVARLVAALAHASGDRELAFDLAQETFARALERGYRVRLAEDGSAWPWLWTVGRNLLRDRQRRDGVDARARRRLGIAAAPYDEQAVDELIERVDATELRESLADALGGLPRQQREAVVDHVLRGHDYAQLAGHTGLNEQALRARVSRGLRALRLRLSGGRP
jgi:RNA polymerase sigma-70 factor (ECF subfamily)